MKLRKEEENYIEHAIKCAKYKNLNKIFNNLYQFSKKFLILISF